jgi:hypothetical protein
MGSFLVAQHPFDATCSICFRLLLAKSASGVLCSGFDSTDKIGSEATSGQ